MKKPDSADGWLELLHKQFHGESCRAAAIVATSMLDESLKTLFKQKLITSENNDQCIIEGNNAPLGTFSSKINAGYQMGLISKYLKKDLHLIRKIRNEFAHCPFDTTFDTPKIKALVCELEKQSDYNKRNRVVRDAVGPVGTKWDFMGIVAWILYAISSEVDTDSVIKEHAAEFGYIRFENMVPELIRSSSGSEQT